jgi:hypothetical protein
MQHTRHPVRGKQAVAHAATAICWPMLGSAICYLNSCSRHLGHWFAEVWEVSRSRDRPGQPVCAHVRGGRTQVRMRHIGNANGLLTDRVPLWSIACTVLWCV